MKDSYKINIKKNKSLTYVLPIMDDLLDLKFYNNIINCYISFDEGDCLFCILYEWSSDSSFLKFEENIMNNINFDSHEDYEEKVLYKFKLQDSFNFFIDKFKKGEYKDFSIEEKSKIEKYLLKRMFKNKNKIMKILSKNSEIKSEAPVFDNETFLKNISKRNLIRDNFKD